MNQPTTRAQRGRTRSGTLLLGVLALALTAGLTGCEALSFLSRSFAPEKVEAAYQITDRPTLVLVEDRGLKLGDPALTGVIAARVGFELSQAGAVKTFIDPERLTAFRALHNDDWSSLPVDRIGRELGAEQVIHVWISDAAVRQEGPDLLRAEASARVKLVDATTGERLFPQPRLTQPGQSDTDEPGREISVQIDRQIAGEVQRGDAPVLARELADRLGREASGLFYDHLPRQPGEPWE